MFEGLNERIEKTNDQRVTMALTLHNIMINKMDCASIELRSTVAASVMSMLSKSMIPEDGTLIDLLNKGIDAVCSDAKTNYGIPNLRESLESIIKQTAEKMDRINEADNILSKLDLDNINLN